MSRTLYIHISNTTSKITGKSLLLTDTYEDEVGAYENIPDSDEYVTTIIVIFDNENHPIKLIYDNMLETRDIFFSEREQERQEEAEHVRIERENLHWGQP